MKTCEICNKEVKGKRKTCSKECRDKLCGLARKGKATYIDEDGNNITLTVKEATERGLVAASTKYVWSDESKKLASESHKGKRPHNYSEEMRNKISKWSKNKPQEVQDKIRQTCYDKGIWVKPEDKDAYKVYFELTEFKHGYDTINPDERKLLNKYGVFNTHTNSKGCVRDHLLSRKYGFENNIDPEIISHPANCEIVLHAENVRRSMTNDNQITLTELLERIDQYDR